MLINGTEQCEIDARDRGLQYGDGCFTTLLVKNGQLQLWSRHKARLQHALTRLGIIFEQWQDLEVALQDLCLANKAVVKIQITRGVGGRGYTPPTSSLASWLISVSDFPQHYLHWQMHGIRLGLSNIQLAKQPLLAGIKHLNRLEQVLVKRDANEDEYDDVLVCDTDGMLVETSAANIFWCINDVWYTPDLYFSGVDGVMRNLVLDLFKAQGQAVHQTRVPYQHLCQASSVFISNSLMEIVPVVKVLDKEFDIAPVRQLQQQMENMN